VKGVSEKLKKAMVDIDKVVKEHDINACVFLADGLGNGEFKMYHDKPTWSMARFLLNKDGSIKGIHLKVHMKSNPTNAERTVNSIYNIQGMMGNLYIANDGILKQLENIVEIEKDKGKIISHQEYLKNKGEKDGRQG